jgi:hypothetical protein
MPTAKKVRNWKEYNRSLENRGEIIFTIHEEYYQKLYYTGKQVQGGVRRYNKEMFEFILMIQSVLRLPLRAAVGLARSRLFKIENPRLPHFGHISRMVNRLSMKVKAYPPLKKGIVLSFDSTGVSIYSTSNWHRRQHSLSAHNKWRKIHLAMDLSSGQILDCEVSHSTMNDCMVVESMINRFKNKYLIKQLIADGAYDTYDIYRIGTELNAEMIIPPAKTSKPQTDLVKYKQGKCGYRDYLKPRDDVIHFIRRYLSFAEGLKAWKQTSGYHQRSKIESTMHRLKSTFGFAFRYRNKQARKNEAIIKTNLLNQILLLGKAEYVM